MKLKIACNRSRIMNQIIGDREIEYRKIEGREKSGGELAWVDSVIKNSPVLFESGLGMKEDSRICLYRETRFEF